ncbi:MAG: hypothetical protein GY804_09100 [Alphaproteobacteria bacterium]|nr:hypothetical protein [Alphaproteobacteria bacterium]
MQKHELDKFSVLEPGPGKYLDISTGNDFSTIGFTQWQMGCIVEVIHIGTFGPILCVCVEDDTIKQIPMVLTETVKKIKNTVSKELKFKKKTDKHKYTFRERKYSRRKRPPSKTQRRKWRSYGKRFRRK